LLNVSGLRLGEARNLELRDVDLKAAVLTIRGAKFGKTRLVPLHASTCTVVADYLARRQRHWAGRPVSSYLFVSSLGNRLDGGDIHRTFYALSRQIGLRGPSDHRGPRLHDMRHRFATNTLLQWYLSLAKTRCCAFAGRTAAIDPEVIYLSVWSVGRLTDLRVRHALTFGEDRVQSLFYEGSARAAQAATCYAAHRS